MTRSIMWVSLGYNHRAWGKNTHGVPFGISSTNSIKEWILKEFPHLCYFTVGYLYIYILMLYIYSYINTVFPVDSPGTVVDFPLEKFKSPTQHIAHIWSMYLKPKKTWDGRMVDTSNLTNPCALADPTSQHLKPQIRWGSLSYAIQLEFHQRWQSGPLDHTLGSKKPSGQEFGP